MKPLSLDRIPEFLGHFSGAPVPVDLLVYTRAEVEQRLREGNRFTAAVVDKSLMLADKNEHLSH